MSNNLTHSSLIGYITRYFSCRKMPQEVQDSIDRYCTAMMMLSYNKISIDSFVEITVDVISQLRSNDICEILFQRYQSGLKLLVH